MIPILSQLGRKIYNYHLLTWRRKEENPLVDVEKIYYVTESHHHWMKSMFVSIYACLANKKYVWSLLL